MFQQRQYRPRTNLQIRIEDQQISIWPGSRRSRIDGCSVAGIPAHFYGFRSDRMGLSDFDRRVTRIVVHNEDFDFFYPCQTCGYGIEQSR